MWVRDGVVLGVGFCGVRERKRGNAKTWFLGATWPTLIISRIFTRGRYSLIV